MREGRGQLLRRRGRSWVAALAAVTSAAALAVGGGVATTSAAAPGSVVRSAPPADRQPESAIPAGAATSDLQSAGAVPAGRSATHVGIDPENTALDAATHTLYVVSDTFISVLDTRTCSVRTHAGCDAVPTRIRVAGGAGAVVDPATRTLYVAEPGTDSVAVVDIATCNAIRRAGCSRPVHTVAAGIVPVAVDVDRATDTVYAPDWGNGTGTTVSVIDGATCNARNTSGCGQTPATVTTGIGPNGLIVDQRTDTVYTPLVAASGAESVAVIDGATCNAQTKAGCGQTPRTVRVGTGSSNDGVGVAIDQRTRTFYLTDVADDSLSMIDTTTCNGTHGAGCGRRQPIVHVGNNPNAVGLDEATHTLYVPNGGDANLSVIDATTCNAHSSAGCAVRAQRRIRTGLGPADVTVDPTSNTLYVPDQETNLVSVLDGATCNATDARGCTAYPPTVEIGLSKGPFGLALNPRTQSLYVVDNGTTAAGTSVSVVNAARCNAVDHADCGQRPAIVAVGQNPISAAVDTATDTVYVNNDTSDTVSVIDGATCNAGDHVGCHRRSATVKVGLNPFAVAIDQATHTVYVTDAGSGQVSVINAATCNATEHAGCGQTPRTITVGGVPLGIAVDQATDTVYVTEARTANALGHTMSVIDGATCNATVASGCGQAPQNVRTGPGPWGIAIDQKTDTLYVADANGFSGPGSITVLDGALCDATHHGRCGAIERTVQVGPAPLYPAVDQTTGVVYVPDHNGAAVSVIDGSRCDATHHAGCASKPGTVIVGGSPVAAVVDAATHTVYITLSADGTVAILLARR